MAPGVGEVVVRRATPDDAVAGSRCHAACWQEAYADIVDPVTLSAMTADPDEGTRRWATRLAEGRSPHWLGLSGSEVVGFSAAGPGRDEDRPGGLELYACYARAAWWGSGLGAALLAAAIGAEPAYLWVFEANGRARAFYRKHGFVADGSVKDEPHFGSPETRMVRDR